jgi:G3E family GTPase
MKRIRFLMVGGFLGAGKTTAIARLARHYMDQGQKVGIVTNDQAYGLVDTMSLRAQGFQVGEVTGACFCCKFNDLIATAEQLNDEEQPDIIIAEPVGSCTDLMATVMEPLRQLYGEAYEIGPLAVLLKPEHGQKILGGESDVGFSPKAAYIFLKQLEEADVVVVNKVDKLSAAEREEITRLLAERFPGKQVLAISGREGENFDSLVTAMNRRDHTPAATPEVDYDIYAEGEAELGWLNAIVRMRSPTGQAFRLDDVVVRLVERLERAVRQAGGEPAHLKILGSADGVAAIANLVSSTFHAELSLTSGAEVTAVELTVNARVAIAPETLAELVERESAALASEIGLTCELSDLQSFRPGRPVPTHRLRT